MSKPLEQRRCPVCRQRSLRRKKQAFEYSVTHEGRPPVLIRIKDLEVVACTNPDCPIESPGDNVLHDEAANEHIANETSRQLGLLTPAEIREGRERLGLSQQELQELLRLGGNSLSRWESGAIYQSRSLDTLLRLVFGVPQCVAALRRMPWAEGDDSFATRFPYLSVPSDDAALRRRQAASQPARFAEAATVSP